MQVFTATGRLTKKPEYKQVKDKSVASFTLAVDRLGEGADFIPCVCWNKTAELVNKYLDKGSKIGIEGKVQTRSWKDDKGQSHFGIDVLANNIEFLDSKPKETDPYKEIAEQIKLDDEQLPF